jgi:small subunit ribosomal protein S9
MADDETPNVPQEEAAEPQESAPQASAADAPTEEAQAEDPRPEASPEAEPHAVPSEEAREIAAVAEDAALEARQEADEAQPAADDAQAADVTQAADDAPTAPAEDAPQAAEAPQAEGAEPPADAPQPDEDEDDEVEETPREKPAVPGAHLEVDIVPEGVDPLGRGEEDEYVDTYALEQDEAEERVVAEADVDEDEEAISEPISTAAIDLASGARYRATGKRKTAIARVILRPGSGTYLINGRTLEQHFPRETLQRNIRQPLETVGYQDRMDVVARLHGGGISAQAGALRHGVSRALLEADPNLRGELKRRGFLTRDSRAKERKKAGLKKARKRPQFSKR